MDDFQIEIDESEFDEIPEGFTMKTVEGIDFFQDDELGSDVLHDILNSVGSIEFDTSSNEEKLALLEGQDHLLLGEGDSFDIDPEEIEFSSFDEPSYELTLTPAQNALALYEPQEDESFLIETRSEEIHNIIYDVGQYSRNASQRIRDYLDTEQFALIPMNMFLSSEFKKQQDFRSLMVAEFLTHRELPAEYTEDNVVNKIFKAYEEERLPVMTTGERLKMESLVRNFLVYAKSVYDEAEKQTDLVRYQAFQKTIACPEAVSNFTYICKCGGEYEMPNSRPTMTFLIRPMGKDPIVDLMNYPIACETCHHYLTLPTRLVEAIEIQMTAYVGRIKASYEHPRIYRPKITELEQMIPANVKDLFQLSSEQETVTNENNQESPTNSSYTQYIKLINMWMNNVESEDKLNQALGTLETGTKVANLVKKMSLVEFGFESELYAYQYTKTIIHYLERFTCFALKLSTKSLYKYYEVEGIEKKSFDTEYAVKWMYDNASYIAGLNNIYTGDTEMEELDILPEYVDVLNYIITLHLMSNPKVLKRGSDLHKFNNDPTSNMPAVEEAYKKFEIEPKHRLATSVRNLKNTTIMYPIRTWDDTYAILKNLIVKHRYDPEVTAELRDLVKRATKCGQDEFYGIEINERAIDRPTYMFEEFKMAFQLFGHHLFTGPIVDEVRKNLAKGIELVDKVGKLGNMFEVSKKPVTDVTGVLIKKKQYTEEEVNLSYLTQILRNKELPDQLSLRRDEMGLQTLIDNLEEDRDFYVTDEDFMRKYGEVLTSYL